MCPIAVITRYAELGFFAEAHLNNAFVPSFDDLSFADLKFKRATLIATRVEFTSVRCQSPNVVLKKIQEVIMKRERVSSLRT